MKLFKNYLNESTKKGSQIWKIFLSFFYFSPRLFPVHEEEEKAWIKNHREKREELHQTESFPFSILFYTFFHSVDGWGSYQTDVTLGENEKAIKSFWRSRRKHFPTWALASATCNEKLMWKLLPSRSKWKTEHFRCFLMDVGARGLRRVGKIGGLCFGFEEVFMHAPCLFRTAAKLLS